MRFQCSRVARPLPFGRQWRPPAAINFAQPQRRALLLTVQGAPRESQIAASEHLLKPCVSLRSDVRTVVFAACHANNRVPGAKEEALVEKLLENDYEYAEDLLDISLDSRKELKLSTRMYDQLQKLIRAASPMPADSDTEEDSHTGGAAEPPAEVIAPEAGAISSDEAQDIQSYLLEQQLASGQAAGGEASPGPGPGSSALASAAAEADGLQAELHPDIKQRRCPPLRRFGHHKYKEARLTKKEKKTPYALKECEMSPALEAELKAFVRFSTVGVYGAQSDPVRPVTCRKYVANIRAALGWLHRVEGVALEQLQLKMIIPSKERSGVSRVFNFAHWLRTERGIARSSEGECLLAMLALAKYLYHEESRVEPGEKPYSDVDVIKQLRALYMSCDKASKVESRVVDDDKKWLSWDQYLRLVQELRKECAGLHWRGHERPPADVAMSLQVYLMAAILSCIPDRQRTLRELEVGRTLIKDGAGRWTICHTHADYKTGKTYGERPPLVIPAHIYPELEAFIGTWRAALQPTHNYVFSKRCGKPLDVQELSRSFSIHAYRITGRKTNPHLIRDMIVTHARDGNASEHELEALATYMAHSLHEQRSTYDRRTKAQRVEPAAGLMARLAGTAAGAALPGIAAAATATATAAAGALPAAAAAAAASSAHTSNGVGSGPAPAAATAATRSKPAGSSVRRKGVNN